MSVYGLKSDFGGVFAYEDPLEKVAFCIGIDINSYRACCLIRNFFVHSLDSIFPNWKLFKVSGNFIPFVEVRRKILVAPQGAKKNNWGLVTPSHK
jgi:hypothetical protein